jgi:hypothetical protein
VSPPKIGGVEQKSERAIQKKMQSKRPKLIHPEALVRHAQAFGCKSIPNEKSEYMFAFFPRYGQRPVYINGRRLTTLTAINEDCDALGIPHLTEEDCKDFTE